MKKIIYLSVIIVILLGVSIFYFKDKTSIFTAYPVFCQDWFNTNDTTINTFNPPAIQDFSNCHKPKAEERQVFSVDINKNNVIQTSPDNSSVIKLDFCTIQDTTHWSCGSGDLSKMPGGMLAATQINRSADNFNEYGLYSVIFVTKSQWESINNGKMSAVCGSKWCD
jgi:hypothetical protein